MTGNKKKFNRMLSVFLCLCLTLTYLPLSAFSVGAATATQWERTADASTMDQWRDFFLPSTGDVTTENAGGIWTDKTVTTDTDAFTDLGISGVSMTDPNNGMLVALSAMASNMTVTGQASKPIDVVLVLDMSSSMTGATGEGDRRVALAQAANEGLRSLLATPSTRVSVVTYSGATEVMLPLDHYTTTTAGADFLTLSTRSTDDARNGSMSIASGVRDGNGGAVERKTITFKSGTYTQRAIAEAYNVLAADTVSKTDRIPAVILLSDGAPSCGSVNITSPPTYSGTYSENDGWSFMTQLAMAYNKKRIANLYDGTAFLYTIGIQPNNNTRILDVLDPRASMRTDGLRSLWNSWNATAQTGRAVLRTQYGNITKTSELFDLNPVYTDMYIGTDVLEAQGQTLNEALTTALKQIIDEINLQAAYSPTLITGTAGQNLDGYVSFSDKIGRFMHVSDIKGIVYNNTLFTGELLASTFAAGGGNLFGSQASPNSLGVSFMQSIQTRLGITNAEAWEVMRNAWQKGQISYTENPGGSASYSNWFGWLSTSTGAYLEPWAEGNDLPDTAAYLNKSYIFLSDANPDAPSGSNMMYATVRVREPIIDGKLSGEQEVNFNIPSGLLPTLTYGVSLNQAGEVIGLTTTNVTPIRLVYEVAVNDDINGFNVKEKVGQAYLIENYNGEYPNVTADGGVNLYTNQYEIDGSTGYNPVTQTLASNTYAYYRPSKENNRHYYQQQDELYIDYVAGSNTATLYEGADPIALLESGTDFYHCYEVYAKTGTNTYEVQKLFHKLQPDTVRAATRTGNTGPWLIPVGTVRRDYAGYTMPKTGTTTGTLDFVAAPFIDAGTNSVNDPNHRFTVGSTLGNNGRITIVEETGLKLSKELAAGATETTKDFTFTITNTTNAAFAETITNTYKVAADGTTSSPEVVFVAGVATVTLKAGETLYIADLTVGDTFTVAETPDADYMVAAVNGGTATEAQVTITANDFAEAAFTNTDRGRGRLSISKEVENDYNGGAAIPQNEHTKFTMTVTLEGIGVENATFDGIHTFADNTTESRQVTTVNGVFTYDLYHDEHLLLTDLPAGTKATVVESGTGGLYTVSYWENGVKETAEAQGVVEVPADGTSSVIVVNDYNPPSKVSPDVEVSGIKTLNTDHAFNGTFTFDLQRYNGTGAYTEDTSWTSLLTTLPSVTYDSEIGGTKYFDFGAVMSNEEYTAVGTYIYRIIEKRDNPIDGVLYDSDIHTFQVNVTDADMDGQLEINDITGVTTNRGNVVSVTPPTGGAPWDVEAQFTNRFTNDSTARVTIDVQKAIDNPSLSPTGTNLAGFEFSLHVKNPDGTRGAKVAGPIKTNSLGAVRFTIDYTVDDIGTKSYLLVEGDKGPAWTPDVSEITVTVSIDTDGSNNLVAVVTDDKTNTANEDNSMVTPFLNHYDPDSVPLTIDFIRKELNGRTLKNGEFTFGVFENTATTRDETTALSVGRNDTSGNVTFDRQLTYTKVGTYFYDIQELSKSGNGVTVDGTVYRLTVTVSDVNGVLTPRYTLNNASDEAVFRNTYKAEPVTLDITGYKSLVGRTDRAMAAGEFEFTLKRATNSSGTIDTEHPQTFTATNHSDGKFVFHGLEFTEAGTYYYALNETVPTVTNGIQYFTDTIVVTVTVTDNGAGQLSATYSPNGLNLLVTNTYVPTPINLTVTGTKSLLGRPLGTDTVFTFAVWNSTEHGGVPTGAPLTTADNDENGLFTFDLGEVSTAGTKWFIIQEVAGTLPYIEYNETYYKVRVDVTDNSLGKLSYGDPIVMSLDGEIVYADLLVENYYRIIEQGSVTLSGEKTLNGRDSIDGEFTFELYQTDETYSTDGIEPLTATNQDGRYEFTLPFTDDAIGNTYYCVIREKYAGTTVDGVTYDTATYRVVIDVSHDNFGKVTATVREINGGTTIAADKLDFTNTYAVAATSFDLAGTKQLLGRVQAVNEFAFDIYAADENYAYSGAPLRTAKNDANGHFVLENIPLATAGTHRFVVKENGTAGLAGITYDRTEYRVDVVVTDNGDGTLTVGTPKLMRPDGREIHLAEAMVFNNTYCAKDATVVIKAMKTLTGRALKDGEFAFLLREADSAFAPVDGGEVLKALNAADGTVTFDALTFSEAGTYYYVLTEDTTVEAERVTFDQSVYYVTVTVTDEPAKGQLNAAVTVKKGENSVDEITFANVYTPESKPKPVPIPQTGVTSDVTLWMALLFVSGGLVGARIFGKKKEEKES